MVRKETRNSIQTRLIELAKEWNDPVPNWGFVSEIEGFKDDGTSFFDHDTQDIYFSDLVVNDLEADNDIVDLEGLVAHEFWHFHQFFNGINQKKPRVREVNARRFAKQFVEEKFPGRLREFNVQPIPRDMRDLPIEPGIDRQQIDGRSERDIEAFLERVPDLDPIQRRLVEEAFSQSSKPISTSLWLRARLEFEGAIHPYGLWREFHDLVVQFGQKPPTYKAVRTLIWVLHRKLNFVRRVHADGEPVEEESNFGECCPRHPYEVVFENVTDSRWINPVGAVYGSNL